MRRLCAEGWRLVGPVRHVATQYGPAPETAPEEEAGGWYSHVEQQPEEQQRMEQ